MIPSKRKTVIVLVSLAVALLNPMKVQAIEGGFSKPEFLSGVVPFFSSNSDKSIYCSGALVSEYLVATAAHCVVDNSSRPLKEIWVAPAGTDVTKELLRLRVSGVFVPSAYKGSSSSKVKDNDIAFITVKSPLGKSPFSRIATVGETRSYYGQSVYVAGYGRVRPGGPTSSVPMFVLQRIIDWNLPEFTFGNYVHVVATDTEAPCPGDSGGPLFKESGKELLLLGVMAGTNGCINSTARDERLVGFNLGAFMDTLQTAKNSISSPARSPEDLKVELIEDKVKVSWKDVADNLLRSTLKYLLVDESENTLCEAFFIGIFNNQTQCEFTINDQTSEEITLIPIGISKNGTPQKIDVKKAVIFAKEKKVAGERAKAEADAKAKAEADAKAKAEADAKAKAEADAKAKAEADAKAKAEADAKAKAEADAKAKAEADAKAKAEADAKAKAEAESSVEVVKEKTIICKKGKRTKKITGFKPKCPKGYKKR